jgi:hypothetical protein
MVEVRHDDHRNHTQRLELRSGLATLTIDKEAGKIRMKRKKLLWQCAIRRSRPLIPIHRDHLLRDRDQRGRG